MDQPSSHIYVTEKRWEPGIMRAGGNILVYFLQMKKPMFGAVLRCVTVAERKVELRYPNLRAGTKLRTKALPHKCLASSVLSGFVTAVFLCEITSDSILNPVFLPSLRLKVEAFLFSVSRLHHSKSRELSEPGAVKSNG